MSSPVILRKRNRNFLSDLKPNHSKFEDLKNPFVKLKSLKSLSFLNYSKSSLASANYLRKSASDTYLLNWKVKKKELRKIEKQFVEIKMKYDQELNYNSTILKCKNDDIAKVKIDLDSTFLTTFPMQFGGLFTMKNFTFPENSIFESLGTLFSKNTTRMKDEKGVNTSFSRLCKDIQTDTSKDNTKTQNVRVKKKSKRVQTDPINDNNAISKRIERKNKAANLNFKSLENEFIEEHPIEEEIKQVPQVHFGHSKQNSHKIASKAHLNPSVFSFSRYNHFLDTCGFDIFSNFLPTIASSSSDPKTSDKFKPTKVSRTTVKITSPKHSNDKVKINSIKRPSIPIKIDNSDKKKFQCNTATMDQVCSVETKKSVDLIALRNYILKYSPLTQKPSLVSKKTIDSIKSEDEEYMKPPKKKNHSSKAKAKKYSKDSRGTPRKAKRNIKKRQSVDKSIGTDCDEITDLVPRINKINFELEGNNFKSLSPIPNNLDFKPILFEQNQNPTLGVSKNDSPTKRIRKSSTFRSGLVQKSSKPQCGPSKFVGRRGNIFDYVSCITSTSSTIYSSTESIKKIFARSKMSILTVDSDYNSLLKILSKSTDQNIRIINCDDLKKDVHTINEDQLESKAEEIIPQEPKLQTAHSFKQEIIVAHVHVEPCSEEMISKAIEEDREKSKFNLEISDEEKVVEVTHYNENDSFDDNIEVKESKTRKCKQFGSKILKTISKLSHRKKASNILDAKLLKKSSDKLYKKKYKDILKDYKIQKEFAALKKDSSSKMQKQYIFNIGHIEGVTTSPLVINLRVDNLELSEKCLNKTNKLKSIFNRVTSKSSNKISQKSFEETTQESNTQCKRYSDEIIAKEEQRSQVVEEVSKEENITTLYTASSKAEILDDLMNKSLEDIRILFKSTFSSETEISENELGDQNKKNVVQKKFSSVDIKTAQKLIELKINPSNSHGEKCFVNPLSIYVDPNIEAIGAHGKYKIDCLESIVVDSINGTMCHDKDFKKPMKVQVNLILYQL